ncbi:MAG: WG repeat-containing protein [Saprospiraceae bacterium]|nr:WG repeat-containing protein [Saprospiraceae bacterium]
MLCLFWCSCKSPHFAIPAQFDAVFPFYEGIAPAKKQDLWGFIDSTGSWIIQPKFKELIKTENGKVLIVLENGDHTEVTKNKESGEWEIKTPEFNKIEIQTASGIRYIEKKGGFYILVEADGTPISSEYISILYAGEDLFVCQKNYEGQQLIHADGSTLTPFYDEIDSIIQYGRIRFREDRKYGLLDPAGKVILEPSMWLLEIAGYNIACTIGGDLELHTDQLQKLSDWKFDRIQYLSADRWMGINSNTGLGTICDLDGNQLVKDIFVSNGEMKYGKLPARNKNEKWGYLDHNGKEVIPFEYGYTTTFMSNGAAIFEMKNPIKGWFKGVLDTTNTILLPADNYDEILYHDDGIYTIVQGKSFQLFNEKFEPLTKKLRRPAEYIGNGVYIVYKLKTKLEFESSNWYTGRKGGLKISREGFVKGIYSLDGQLLVSGNDYNEDDNPPQCNEGFAAAKSGKRWGFVKCNSHKSPD